MSRPLDRWLRASMGCTPPTSGLYSSKMIRSSAGITQPNRASNGFHRSFGFQDAGLPRGAARKHDSWHDVAWMQLDLLDALAARMDRLARFVDRRPGDIQTVKKPSRRYAVHHWFCQGGAVDSSSTCSIP
jgi:hypothetical protein